MVEFSESYQPADEARRLGRNKRKVMTSALMLALEREVAGSDGKPTKRITVIAEKLAAKAAEGDMIAIKEVFDRTEGKATQAIEASGPDGAPVAVTLITLVAPEDNGSKD